MHKFRKIKKNNICLIGFMGSGKSAIAKEMSKIYNLDFYDTDYEIEKKSGCDINHLFNNFGEQYFRNMEHQVCADLLKNKDCVISLGGGSIINPSIRKLLKDYSFTIYLKVDLETLKRRLKSSKKRPLLNDPNKIEIIQKLLKKKENFYNRADLILENNFSKKELIKKINSSLI